MPYDKDCNILFEMYLSHSASPAPMSGKVKSPIMIKAGQKDWETRRLNNYRRLCDEMERRKQQG